MWTVHSTTGAPTHLHGHHNLLPLRRGEERQARERRAADEVVASDVLVIR
jgi:hypothetical protein